MDRSQFLLMGCSEQNELSTRLVLVGVKDKATKEDFLAVSACSVRDNCAPYSEGAAIDNRELSGRRRRCLGLGFFMPTMKLPARAELRNMLLQVQTSLSLQVICKNRYSQKLAKLGHDYQEGVQTSAA